MDEAVVGVPESSLGIGRGKQKVGESSEVDVPAEPSVVTTSVSNPLTVRGGANVEDPHADLDTHGRQSRKRRASFSPGRPLRKSREW